MASTRNPAMAPPTIAPVLSESDDAVGASVVVDGTTASGRVSAWDWRGGEGEKEGEKGGVGREEGGVGRDEEETGGGGE